MRIALQSSRTERKQANTKCKLTVTQVTAWNWIVFCYCVFADFHQQSKRIIFSSFISVIMNLSLIHI